MLAQADGLEVVGGAATAGSWLLEPKFDGLRCIAVGNGGVVELFSRNRNSYSSRFASIASALALLALPDFALDGEIVGTRQGLPDFGALQQGGADAVEYWVFDMPWLLGHDLRPLPIEERKALLARAVPASGPVKLVEALAGRPEEALARMCDRGWEGVVAKRAGSPYRGGRSADWQKLKCGCRQELVLGGYTEPRGARQRFGALLLGYWSGGELVYAGKVGTGFSERSLDELARLFTALERATSPFAELVREKGAHWLEPELVAEVAFSNWTADGRLRHPSFLGLRPDKPSTEVVREPANRGTWAQLHGHAGPPRPRARDGEV
jgi:bifunctional non-homologous end joining protein LigD